jgi:phosphopantetheine adenylyltransferase
MNISENKCCDYSVVTFESGETYTMAGHVNANDVSASEEYKRDIFPKYSELGKTGEITDLEECIDVSIEHYSMSEKINDCKDGIFL